MGDYDRDFERAKQDRGDGVNGLVSIAYWIARGIQLLFRAVARAIALRRHG